MYFNMTCGEIQSSMGFEYVIPNQTLNDPDCEQSWYSEDRRLLADPSDPQTLNDPVTSVSSDRLVTSDCVNLIHEIICDASGWRMETVFRAFNDTESSGGSTQTPDSHQFWWISALLFIFLLLFICFMLKKRIFSCISRAVTRIRRVNQTERKKDLEDPEAGVQMKIGSDAPDSLSQSESEQLNGSVSRGRSV